MESFTPKINDKVNFYARTNIIATLIDRNGNIGLFLFENGSKFCYGINLPISWKI